MSVGELDVLIRGARVVDGTGNPWFYGDVAIDGPRIAAIAPPGRLPAENAREVVDATGLVVCPGFIDIQSHSIIPLMRDPTCLSKVTQGVTTEIMGELWTPAPFGGRIAHPFDSTLAGALGAPPPEWRQQARESRRTSARSSPGGRCAGTPGGWRWGPPPRTSWRRCGGWWPRRWPTGRSASPTP
jgi:N-acyl-D-amino-acid deacylase